jgi:hypothetical protein
LTQGCEYDKFDSDAYALALAQERHKRGLPMDGLDLSAINFDPQKHPRDLKGRFRDVLGKLDDTGRAMLPDGVEVTKRGKGFRVAGAGRPEANFNSVDEAAGSALARSAANEHPKAVGGRKAIRDLHATSADEDFDKARASAQGPTDSYLRDREPISDNFLERQEAQVKRQDAAKADSGMGSGAEPDHDPVELAEAIANNAAEFWADPESYGSQEDMEEAWAEGGERVWESMGDGTNAELDTDPDSSTIALIFPDGTRIRESADVDGSYGVEVVSSDGTIIDRKRYDGEQVKQGGDEPSGGGSNTGMAKKHGNAIRDYLEESMGVEEYDDDEATEYGGTNEEKFVGVGMDTGAFGEVFEDIAGDDLDDYDGTGDGGIEVKFKDGTSFKWKPTADEPAGAPHLPGEGPVGIDLEGTRDGRRVLRNPASLGDGDEFVYTDDEGTWDGLVKFGRIDSSTGKGDPNGDDEAYYAELVSRGGSKVGGNVVRTSALSDDEAYGHKGLDWEKLEKFVEGEAEAAGEDDEGEYDRFGRPAGRSKPPPADELTDAEELLQGEFETILSEDPESPVGEADAGLQEYMDSFVENAGPVLIEQMQLGEKGVVPFKNGDEIGFEWPDGTRLGTDGYSYTVHKPKAKTRKPEERDT